MNEKLDKLYEKIVLKEEKSFSRKEVEDTAKSYLKDYKNASIKYLSDIVWSDYTFSGIPPEKRRPRFAQAVIDEIKRLKSSKK